MRHALRQIGVGLLLIGGAVSVPEARRLAGLPKLTDGQEDAYKKMYYWCKTGAQPMMLSRPDFWKWSAFWDE